MPSPVQLRFADDISIVVPDSLELITSYVLREQHDWFEDEIRFVRSLLKPGQQAIDIGANYGVFTLSMAKVVGAGGRIWAFEPASSTAALLAESLRANGFHHVVLDQRALSDHAGIAQLSLHQNSELNELVREGAAAGTAETVALISLDDAMREYRWREIDFVKIDAEGEEAAIIRGGRDFFQALSPLIQYEVKASTSIHLELVQAFLDIGYTSYRLVPGLGALVPFNIGETVDGYLLNLFCCKPARAAQLAAAGRLVLASDLQVAAPALPGHAWQEALARLPYGRHLASTWLQTVARGQSREIERALGLYARSQDRGLPIAERALALRSSLEILTAVCGTEPGFLRLASLARVAQAFGARTVAVEALDAQLKRVTLDRQVRLDEPFLASSEHYDHREPGTGIDTWVLCSILEGLERNSSFSSFYTGPAAKQRLRIIGSLGFGSPEMGRRLALLEQRYP